MNNASQGTHALNFIRWPFRILITGPSESGKTTAALQIIEAKRPKFQRLIVISPTFTMQDVFRDLDSMIANPKRDIFSLADGSTFDRITDQLKLVQERCLKAGIEPIRTLIFVDDNSSNKAIHGGRMGALGNLAATCRHYGASLLCICHQGKGITPGMRNNTTGFIAFPTTNRNEISLITSEFGNPIVWSDATFRRAIAYAWRGGLPNKKEWGKHFLFVLSNPREHPKFFVDFGEEIYASDDEDDAT